MEQEPAGDPVLGPRDIARMLGIDVRTASRYAKEGKLPEGFRTPGGHHRWYQSDVLAACPGLRPLP
jgi:predicted site-specific integrase-resolvase